MKKYHFGLIILLLTASSVPSALAVSISISESFNFTDLLRAYCSFCVSFGDIPRRTGVSDDQALVDASVEQAASALVYIFPGMLIIGTLTYAGHKLGAHDKVLVLIFLLALTAISMPPLSIFPPWVTVFTVIGLLVMFLYGRNKQPSGNITT